MTMNQQVHSLYRNVVCKRQDMQFAVPCDELQGQRAALGVHLLCVNNSDLSKGIALARVEDCGQRIRQLEVSSARLLVEAF
jgi:hypothetical protein